MTVIDILPRFTFDQYQKMASLIGRLKGKAIISLNDHPAIRDRFKDYAIESTDIRYTVGGGQGKEAREIHIFN